MNVQQNRVSPVLSTNRNPLVDFSDPDLFQPLDSKWCHNPTCFSDNPDSISTASVSWLLWGWSYSIVC